HALANLCGRGFAAQLLNQLPRGANQLVESFDYVHREADGASLIGNGAADCLANPPRRIGRKFVAAAVFELIHCLHEADVALLDQIEELKPAVGILLGDGNHEAQVGFDELVFSLLRIHLALNDFALRTVQFLEVHAGFAFKPFRVGAILPERLAVIFLRFFAARALNLLFQTAYLAIQRAHDVEEFIRPVDQALAFKVAEPEVADDDRDPNNLAVQAKSTAALFSRFLFF